MVQTVQDRPALYQGWETHAEWVYECCNGNIRREQFNAYVLKTLEEVRLKMEEYMVDYNYHRSYKALNYRVPADLLEDV